MTDNRVRHPMLLARAWSEFESSAARSLSPWLRAITVAAHSRSFVVFQVRTHAYQPHGDLHNSPRVSRRQSKGECRHLPTIVYQGPIQTNKLSTSVVSSLVLSEIWSLWLHFSWVPPPLHHSALASSKFSVPREARSSCYARRSSTCIREC